MVVRENIKCFNCFTKWRLANIEWYKYHKICADCPDNIRCLYDADNEGFACPQCQHEAHIKLEQLLRKQREEGLIKLCRLNCGQFVYDNNASTICCNNCRISVGDHDEQCKKYNNNPFNNNNIPLCVVQGLADDECLYLQIKQANYFQMMKVRNSMYDGDIIVNYCDKTGRCISDAVYKINLSDIARENIIWSYCPNSRGYNSLFTSQVLKIIQNNCNQVSIKTKKDSNINVKLEQIIHTKKWLEYVEHQKKKENKRKRIPFNRNDIFKYSQSFHRQKSTSKKSQKDHIEVVETAPMNQRHFNNNNNNNLIQNQSSSLANTPIQWQCPLCTFINTNIQNDNHTYKCEICDQDTEVQVQHNQQNQEEKSPDTLHIVHELAQKMNVNLNRNANFAPNISLTLNDISPAKITLLLGESGCGKSSLLRNLYHNENTQGQITFLKRSDLEWNPNRGIISQFDETDTDKIISLMSSIGLNSVTTWLKPYHILSNGEKYRSSFARLLNLGLQNQNQWIMKDEFTSCLDRANARCIAACINKYIRKHKPDEIASFIVASSKADIIPYLQPDIVISLAGNKPAKILQNPNNLHDKQSYIPDIKVVLDLPPFDQVRQYKKSLYEFINSQFDDGKVYKSISIDKKVSRLQCEIELDQHTEVVGSVFDITFDGKISTDIAYLEEQHIAMEHGFQIGVIYGPSGSGKTTTGERLFGRINMFNWDENKRICQHFESLQDMEEKFEACSLSITLGLSKYTQLSQGEQDRVNIAIQLGQDNILIDEFTSNLDRSTAKKLALGVRYYIHRKGNKGIVILSCHCDFIAELQPNWLFDIEHKKVLKYKVNSAQFRSPPVRNRMQNLMKKHEYIDTERMWKQPVIRLFLRPTHWHDFKPKFSKFHYMTSVIAQSALCFTVWADFNFNGGKSNEDEIVGFISVMSNPFVNNIHMDEDHKFHYREHRTVILPPYQGLGFGSRVCDAVATYLSMYGKRLQSKTAHPRYGKYRDNSCLWMALKTNHLRKKRKQWQTETARAMGIKKASEEKDKIFYSHVFKLKYQRSQADQNYLDQRVIVVKKNSDSF